MKVNFQIECASHSVCSEQCALIKALFKHIQYWISNITTNALINLWMAICACTITIPHQWDTLFSAVLIVIFAWCIHLALKPFCLFQVQLSYSNYYYSVSSWHGNQKNSLFLTILRKKSFFGSKKKLSRIVTLQPGTQMHWPKSCMKTYQWIQTDYIKHYY